MDLLTAFLAAHPSLLVLFWPLLSGLVTALWQRPSTAQILASAGGRHLVLTVWDRVLYLAAAMGIDSRSVVALLRALLTPRNSKLPPPPPLPVVESIPVVHAPLESTPMPRSAARLATFACVLAAWLTAGAVMACSGLTTDVTSYAPSANDEAAFVSYATAEESCALEDASVAVRQACVLAVKCSYNRAEAGACDAGNAAHDAFVAATLSIGADK